MTGRALLLAAAVAAGCTAPPRPADPEPVPAPEPVEETGPVERVEPVAPPAGPFASLTDYQAQRQAAVDALAAAIGEPTAGAVVACQVLSVGEKACGGPVGFVVMSTETASVPDVLGLAGRVGELDRQATAQFELASTCEMRTAPAPALRDGRCVLAQ